MFRQNTNTIKNFASGVQNKQMTTKHYFGSKTVKYLGDTRMRTAELVKGEGIGSLINMVSKGKPQLPFLFVGGGLNQLTQMNLVKYSDSKKSKSEDWSGPLLSLPGESKDMALDFEGMNEHDIKMLKGKGYTDIKDKKISDEAAMEIERNQYANDPLFDFSKWTLETNKSKAPNIQVQY